MFAHSPWLARASADSFNGRIIRRRYDRPGDAASAAVTMFVISSSSLHYVDGKLNLFSSHLCRVARAPMMMKRRSCQRITSGWKWTGTGRHCAPITRGYVYMYVQSLLITSVPRARTELLESNAVKQLQLVREPCLGSLVSAWYINCLLLCIKYSSTPSLPFFSSNRMVFFGFGLFDHPWRPRWGNNLHHY